MTSRFARYLTALAFLIVVGRPVTGEAAPITITSVQVTIGAATFTAATVGWLFPVTLATAGEDLVLAQNNGGYTFDTSDVLGDLTPTISITANGVTTTFTDTLRVLNVRGMDTSNTVDNEAQNYGMPLIGPGYQVFLGYADNVHTGACGGWASSIGLNGSGTCFPSPFSGASPRFQAVGAPNPSLVQTNPNHCLDTDQNTLNDCYDSGVIRIVATQTVPEPATFALLMTGGAVLLSRRYARGRRMRA